MANIVETKVAVILLHKLSPYDLYLAFNVLTIFEHDHLLRSRNLGSIPSLFLLFKHFFSENIEIGIRGCKKMEKTGVEPPIFYRSMFHVITSLIFKICILISKFPYCKNDAAYC